MPHQRPYSNAWVACAACPDRRDERILNVEMLRAREELGHGLPRPRSEGWQPPVLGVEQGQPWLPHWRSGRSEAGVRAAKRRGAQHPSAQRRGTRTALTPRPSVDYPAPTPVFWRESSPECRHYIRSYRPRRPRRGSPSAAACGSARCSRTPAVADRFGRPRAQPRHSGAAQRTVARMAISAGGRTGCTEYRSGSGGSRRDREL